MVVILLTHNHHFGNIIPVAFVMGIDNSEYPGRPVFSPNVTNFGWKPVFFYLRCMARHGTAERGWARQGKDI